MRTPSDRRRLALAALLLATGTVHFVVPGPYEDLIPSQLGNARAWVYGSGAAELAVGAWLLRRDQARLAGWAAVAVLVAVYPGNVKMALDAGWPRDGIGWAAWLRLPLQAPLVWWAWRVATDLAAEDDPAT